MRLLELYKKFVNSGIGGAPVITDAELSVLNAKLYEVKEFLAETNLGVIGTHAHIMSVESIQHARKLRV